ncbi:unnamed protein product [Meloidogyne enterolobii]|uniref:Uncharacterized protein n=1 Tax=Meloidogyne enterolobii TaxID=390850 RepID=A0ACB1A7S0_MELEN
MQKHWNEIIEKSLKDINENEIEEELNILLINLLPISERNEILEKDLGDKMKEKLYFYKICEYFIYSKEQNMDGKLTRTQRNFVQEMLNLKEKQEINEWVAKAEERINELIKMKEQIKLGKNYVRAKMFSHTGLFLKGSWQGWMIYRKSSFASFAFFTFFSAKSFAFRSLFFDFAQPWSMCCYCRWWQ